MRFFFALKSIKKPINKSCIPLTIFKKKHSHNLSNFLLLSINTTAMKDKETFVKDDLFELIQSLTKTEKRYFKIYASRHIIGEEKKIYLTF